MSNRVIGSIYKQNVRRRHVPRVKPINKIIIEQEDHYDKNNPTVCQSIDSYIAQLGLSNEAADVSISGDIANSLKQIFSTGSGAKFVNEQGCLTEDITKYWKKFPTIQDTIGHLNAIAKSGDKDLYNLYQEIFMIKPVGTGRGEVLLLFLTNKSNSGGQVEHDIIIQSENGTHVSEVKELSTDNEVNTGNFKLTSKSIRQTNLFDNLTSFVALIFPTNARQYFYDKLIEYGIQVGGNTLTQGDIDVMFRSFGINDINSSVLESFENFFKEMHTQSCNVIDTGEDEVLYSTKFRKHFRIDKNGKRHYLDENEKDLVNTLRINDNICDHSYVKNPGEFNTDRQNFLKQVFEGFDSLILFPKQTFAGGRYLVVDRIIKDNRYKFSSITQSRAEVGGVLDPKLKLKIDKLKNEKKSLEDAKKNLGPRPTQKNYKAILVNGVEQKNPKWKTDWRNDDSTWKTERDVIQQDIDSVKAKLDALVSTTHHS